MKTNGSTCLAPRSRQSTPPAQATSSPGCSRPHGRPDHEEALRRACAAGALATLVPGAGDSAPYAEAIDDAIDLATEGPKNVSDDDQRTRTPTGRRLAGHAVPALHAGRAPSASCTLDRPEGAQCDDAGDVLRHRVRGHATSTPTPSSPACSSPAPATCSRPAAISAAATAATIGWTSGRRCGWRRPAVRHAAARRSSRWCPRSTGCAQGGGLQIAMCSDMAVVSDRATFRVPELYRGIADTYYSHMLARLIGPVRTRDLMFTGRDADRPGGRRLGHGRARRSRTTAARQRPARCSRSAAGPRRPRAAVVKSSLDNYMGLFDRIGMRPSLGAPEVRRGLPGVQGAALPELGAPRPADRRPALAGSAPAHVVGDRHAVARVSRPPIG